MTQCLVEEIVDSAHFFGTEAYLMCLPHVVAVLVAGDIARVFAVFVGIHLVVIGDSDMVVAEKTIHAVVNSVAIISAVGDAAILTRMTMEVAAFPIG